MTSLTNKKEGFEFVILSYTSARLFSEDKKTYFRLNIFILIDYNFQCDFSILSFSTSTRMS